MLFIVDRKHRIIRSCVGDIRIECWFLHDTYMRSDKGYATVLSQSSSVLISGAGSSLNCRSLNPRPTRRARCVDSNDSLSGDE
jgi:hypothetical protein